MTTNFPVDMLLEKVKDAISNQQLTESENQEKSHTKCPHHFGYLAEFPKNALFPEGCLLCSRVVECLVPPWAITLTFKVFLTFNGTLIKNQITPLLLLEKRGSLEQ